MQTYNFEISRVVQVRFFLVAKLISASCYVIGWFMPYYFAGRLERGNVCEYFIMQQHFHELGITEHDRVLYEMGIAEKEHEEFFLDGITHKRLLPIFQRVFAWGSGASCNAVDLAAPHDPTLSSQYCHRDSGASYRARPSRRLRTSQRPSITAHGYSAFGCLRVS
jgi:hypothetical protein